MYAKDKFDWIAGRTAFAGLAGGVLLLTGGACTWVAPTEGGQRVRAATLAEVSGCERLGKTHVSTQDRVWVFARSDEKVREELLALARNESALMGGDRVTPESGVEGGRQAFGVYRCGR